MSQNDSKKYRELSTAQLEEMLRRPGLSTDAQQFIQEELTRRYTEELLNEAPAQLPPPIEPKKPPATVARPTAPEFTSASPRQLSTPTPDTLVPPPKAAEKGRNWRGCAFVVLLIVIGAVLLLSRAGGQRQLPIQSSPSYGTVCDVGGGNYCPMQVSLPVGSRCVCSNGISQFPGVVR